MRLDRQLMSQAKTQPDTVATTMQFHPVVKEVARGLRGKCGVPEGAHVLVAVSGGADSVALLRAIHAIKERRRWRLSVTVGHVQHHLRGEDAEQDARFVASLARQLGLPYLRKDLDPAGAQGNVENWARKHRYRTLKEMAGNCGASFIATAHHGDDQLETLLMRLLRGTALKGLSGIRYQIPCVNETALPKKNEQDTSVDDTLRQQCRYPDIGSHTPGPTIIRPMLTVSRADVTDFLKKLNQDWRTDHSNADTTRWRARLRAEVLPVLEAMRPKAGQRATRLAEYLQGMQRVLEAAVQEAETCVVPVPQGYELPRPACRAMERVVLSGLLRKLLVELGVNRDKLSAPKMDRVLCAIYDRQGGSRVFQFPTGIEIIITRDTLRLHRR
ncbi:MAG: hypothetical protein Kow00105_14430 [Phycisphaeraceae bacterium]